MGEGGNAQGFNNNFTPASLVSQPSASLPLPGYVAPPLMGSSSSRYFHSLANVSTGLPPDMVPIPQQQTQQQTQGREGGFGGSSRSMGAGAGGGGFAGGMQMQQLGMHMLQQPLSQPNFYGGGGFVPPPTAPSYVPPPNTASTFAPPPSAPSYAPPPTAPPLPYNSGSGGFSGGGGSFGSSSSSSSSSASSYNFVQPGVPNMSVFAPSGAMLAQTGAAATFGALPPPLTFGASTPQRSQKQ